MNRNLICDNRKEGKRRFEEDEEDHIESRYRVNRSLIKTIEREKKVKLALPIKTATGKLVQNYMAEDDSDEETVTEKEPVQEKHQVVVEEERPKTAMELIREKNEFFEMSKEKIAFLCRQVMSNPQEQVILKEYFDLSKIIYTFGIDEKTQRA